MVSSGEYDHCQVSLSSSNDCEYDNPKVAHLRKVIVFEAARDPSSHEV